MSATMELTIAQEAGAWVFRLKDDESAACREELTAWLQTSPRHVAEFLLASATEVELDGLDAKREHDIDALLAESAPNVIALAPSNKRPALPAPRRGWAVAAGVAVLAICSGLLWQYGFRAETYQTDIGEQRAVKLDDGSVVQLNTRSRIQVKFSKSSRVIELEEGEALFTAAPDPSRPFEVQAGSASVRAVGTQFNVYRRPGGENISVAEGRVRIASETGDKPLLLDAGEEAAATADGRIVQSTRPDIARALAWRQRSLEFRSATVAEVAAEFNRYNRSQFRIADPALAARRMSGLFNADEPESLLDFLTNEGDVQFEKTPDGITLRSIQRR